MPYFPGKPIGPNEMSDKRKPDLTLLVRPKRRSVSVKVELFRSTKWEPHGDGNKFRIRVQGKFWPVYEDYEGNHKPRKGVYYTIEQVTEFLNKEFHRILD
jgi:hypothetical protein